MLPKYGSSVRQMLKGNSLNSFLTVVLLSGLFGFAIVVLGATTQSDQSGFAHWSAAQLRGYAKKLAPKINAGKLASEQLGKYANHSISIAHRQGSGESEVHETQADFFIVQSGEATLVLGGEMVEGKTTTPGEVRGSSIKGGERRKLTAGDVVHISAKVPHQLLLASGKEFNYTVVKVDEPK